MTMRVGAIVLAAGGSTRLGEAKQLVRLGGETLIDRAVRVAREASCDPVVVILGASAAAILAQCPLTGARMVINEMWSEGMAASIRAGVASVGDDVDGAILLTCDQPAVSSKHLLQLMAHSNNEIVGSAYAGKCGVPAYFPADRFGELLALRGDEGARSLLRSAVAVELEGGDLDIDTTEHLAEAITIYGNKSLR